MRKLKLWQKQYLSTLLLFLFVFYGCILFLAHNSFSKAFSLEQQAAAEECTMILRAIGTERAMVAARGGASKAADEEIILNYAEYYKRKGVEFRCVYEDGEMIYNSFHKGFAPRESVGTLILKEDKYGERYFYTSADLDGCIISYARSAEHIFIQQNRNNMILLGAAGVFTATLTLGLFFMLRRVYRPVDNLAHELRTPLTAINGYAQFIAYAAIDEEERLEAVSFIMEESRRLQEIVDKLLILSNLKEGEVNREKVSVEELFLRAEKLYPGIRWKAEQKYIYGDAALLESLVGNLTENAAKVSPNTEDIELIAKDNCITVMDRGSGLTEEMLKRLNDPDSRERHSETGGAGLGVPLCHQIATLHGAVLTFANRPDGGTEAKVEFLQLHNNSIAISKHRRGIMEKNKEVSFHEK